MPLKQTPPRVSGSHVETLIIGGGQAGLAMSEHLSKHCARIRESEFSFRFLGAFGCGSTL
jgi:hypothetical protein